jgi:NAD(P)H-dependent FMN reductase
MKIAIIAASPRPASRSALVATYAAQRLRSLAPGCETDVIDLGKPPLPLWSGDFTSHPADDLSSAWSALSEPLSAAEAFLLVVPEHHGMAPPALMNLLLLCRGELAHKPALLIGVSASEGGAYPLVQLRGSATKNNRLCIIPEQVLVRNVKQSVVDGVFTPTERVGARLDYALGVLAAYAGALGQVRAAGIMDHGTFAFGD